MTIDSINVRGILLWLRVVAISGQLLTLLVGAWLFGTQLPLQALFAVTLMYGIWHGGLLLRLRFAPNHWLNTLSPRVLSSEIAVDLLTVSTLLYLAGGWTNPFTAVLLVPLAFAAAVVSWRRAILLTTIALASYAALVRWYLPLPSVHERFGGDFNVHVLGMWASFVTAALVLVGAVALVRTAFETQRRALAREREARLRDEQLVGIGALAASAAHELGTPLATARLIAEEFENTLEGDLHEQATVLTQQLDAAAERLRVLVRGATRTRGAPAQSLNEFLEKLLTRFSVLRPDVEVRRSGGALPETALTDTLLLESGLLGLLMNAADAHRDDDSHAHALTRIDLSHEISADQLHLRIRDYGVGMPTDRGALGLTPSESSNGLGVGWIISSATFERHGGHASYESAAPGTCVHVWLPLPQLYDSPLNAHVGLS